MPSFNTVDRFVTLVESGQFLEAIDQFYADDASMQENGSTPRVGKDALLKFESAAQASVASVKATCIRPMLISEDIVVIRWVFESVSKKSAPGPVWRYAVHFRQPGPGVLPSSPA